MERNERATSAEGEALLAYIPPIGWMPEYALGMPIIDMQHRGLLAAINSLHFGMANKLGEEMLEPTIEMIKAYTRAHFMTEEFFFAQLGFPDSERHVALHKNLTSAMLDVGQESLFSQDPDRFLQFLKDWLTHHIVGEDRKYRDCFMRRMPANAP